jgi:hypothetical protein
MCFSRATTVMAMRTTLGRVDQRPVVCLFGISVLEIPSCARLQKQPGSKLIGVRSLLGKPENDPSIEIANDAA